MIARLLRQKKGVASLEFAIFGSAILVPVLAGALDCGLLISAYAGVTRAQQAGVMAAWSGAANSTIKTAATSAYSSGSPSVSISNTWYCAPSSSSWTHTGTPYTAPPTCASGNTATQYVSIAVSTTVRLPIPIPGFASKYPIASTATVRLQ